MGGRGCKVVFRADISNGLAFPAAPVLVGCREVDGMVEEEEDGGTQGLLGCRRKRQQCEEKGKHVKRTKIPPPPPNQAVHIIRVHVHVDSLRDNFQV